MHLQIFPTHKYHTNTSHILIGSYTKKKKRLKDMHWNTLYTLPRLNLIIPWVRKNSQGKQSQWKIRLSKIGNKMDFTIILNSNDIEINGILSSFLNL